MHSRSPLLITDSPEIRSSTRRSRLELRPALRLVPLLALLPVAACTGSSGDDDCVTDCTPVDETPTPSPTPGPTPTATPVPAPVDQALVVSSNYSAGKLSSIDLADLTLHSDLLDVSGDTTIRVRDGRVYLFVRDFGADNYVSERDPADGFAEVVRIQTGTGSNPHDVVLVGNKGYVSLYDGDGVGTFDATSGTLGTTIDLTDYADADGKPNADSMVVVGSKLYVALQRYDLGTYSPESPGRVIEIDTTNDPVSKAIDTTVTNIAGITIEESTGDLLVWGAGAYGVADGGVERIHEGASSGVMIAEEDLTSKVLGGFTVADGRGFILDGDVFAGASLVEIDLSDGSITGAVALANSVSAGGLWANGDSLWVSDAAGLMWVIDLGDNTLKTPAGIDVSALTSAGVYSVDFLE